MSFSQKAKPFASEEVSRIKIRTSFLSAVSVIVILQKKLKIVFPILYFYGRLLSYFNLLQYCNK